MYRQVLKLTEPSSVNCVKIAPDKSTFAACTLTGLINVYDYATGAKQFKLIGHSAGISQIEYSPINSHVLASASDDYTVRLWNLTTRKCIRVLKKHTYHVTTVKFTSKGNILISGSADETITIWDLTTGKSIKTLAAHSDPILSISLTDDNSIIVSGSYDGLMRLFDCETGQCLKTLIFNSSSYGTATASTKEVMNIPISHVECSPNGKYVLSSSLDGVMRLWDYMNNKVIKTYMRPGTPICKKYNCRAKFLILDDIYQRFKTPLLILGTDDGELVFWNVQTKEIVNSIKLGDDAIFEIDTVDDVMVACSRDGGIWKLTYS